MNYFKIHKGTHDVGGSCTEIGSGEEKILLDFGSNLPGTYEQSMVPDVKLVNRVFDGKTDYAAVLYSHYQGEHYNLFKRIPGGIPRYMGSTAAEILKYVTEHIDKKSGTISDVKSELLRTYNSLEQIHITDVNNIKILPLVADHSALDVYMFYMKIGDKKILYTGDLRNHGIKGEKDQLLELIDSRKYIPSDIDVLITGAMVNDPQVPVAENVVETELDLGKAVADSFTEHKYNFVMVTPTNLDAIMEIYLNTPEEIPFVIDLYQFRILSKAIHGRRDWFKMYGPRITKDGKIKPVYLLIDHWSGIIGDIIDNLIDDERAKGMFIPYRSDDPTEEFSGLKDGFVMLSRPNHFPGAGQNRFERAMNYFMRVDIRNIAITYSMWRGYLKGDSEDKAIRNFMGNKPTNQMYVSGNAYPDTILKLLEKTNPKYIVPVHRTMSDAMMHIDLFEPFKNRIMKLNEGEIFDLDTMSITKENV